MSKDNGKYKFEKPKNNVEYKLQLTDELYHERLQLFLERCRKNKHEPIGFLFGGPTDSGYSPIIPSAEKVCSAVIQLIASTPEDKRIKDKS